MPTHPRRSSLMKRLGVLPDSQALSRLSGAGEGRSRAISLRHYCVEAAYRSICMCEARRQRSSPEPRSNLQPGAPEGACIQNEESHRNERQARWSEPAPSPVVFVGSLRRHLRRQGLRVPIDFPRYPVSRFPGRLAPRPPFLPSAAQGGYIATLRLPSELFSKVLSGF